MAGRCRAIAGTIWMIARRLGDRLGRPGPGHCRLRRKQEQSIGLFYFVVNCRRSCSCLLLLGCSPTFSPSHPPSLFDVTLFVKCKDQQALNCGNVEPLQFAVSMWCHCGVGCRFPCQCNATVDDPFVSV